MAETPAGRSLSQSSPPLGAPDTSSSRQTPAPGPAAPPIQLRAGQRPLPEYELVQCLGRGGFGEVWKALGPGGFAVALKFIRLADAGSQIELRSLELMKDIKHPHLLVQFGAWQRDDFLIVAMELADGTLADCLQQARAAGEQGIQRTKLLGYLNEAAKALDYLHSRNIQHRDVKPQNLLLAGGGVKVADFGLARLVVRPLSSATGAMTMSYAAPELYQGQISPQTDQYALAVTYCELRGGKLPFEGIPFHLAAGHLMNPPDLSMLPEAEHAVVARALAKVPTERWPSCQAFVNALRQVGKQRHVTMPAPGQKKQSAGTVLQAPLLKPEPTQPPVAPAVTAPPPPPMPASTSPGWEQLPVVRQGPAARLSKRSPWATSGMAVLAGLLLLPGVVVWNRMASEERPDPETDPKTGTSVSTTNLTKITPTSDPPINEKTTDEEPKLEPGGSRFKNSLGMKFVLVKAGSFWKGIGGNNPPVTPTEIRNDFYLAEYEVTQGEWEAVMGSNPSWFSRKGGGKKEVADISDEDLKRFPAENMSWDDIQVFIAKLNTSETYRGWKYRLPLEKEWEYACRACRGGVTSAEACSPHFYFDKPTYRLTHEQANFDKALGRTTKVGWYNKPNGLGLHDMHGSVWEWCDRLSTADKRRAIRGGAWDRSERDCTAWYSTWLDHGLPSNNRGFRLALVPAGK